MDRSVPESGPVGWLHKLGAIGAILVPAGLVVSFFTSGDSGETGAELIAYAEDNATDLWLLQILALVAPLLIGLFVASLWVRLRAANEGLRALTVIGGTFFVAFFSTPVVAVAAGAQAVALARVQVWPCSRGSR